MSGPENIIENLKIRHEVLYQLIQYICDKGLHFDGLTYDNAFGGYFEICFSKVGDGVPVHVQRSFKLNRDPRDPIVDLLELQEGKFQEQVHADFEWGEDWNRGILGAGKKLIDGIKI